MSLLKVIINTNDFKVGDTCSVIQCQAFDDNGNKIAYTSTNKGANFNIKNNFGFLISVQATVVQVGMCLK